MSSSPGRTLVEAQLDDDAQLPGAVNYVTAFVSGAPADQLDAFIDGDPAGSWPLSCDGECNEFQSVKVDATTVGLGDHRRAGTPGTAGAASSGKTEGSARRAVCGRDR
jgi:hypothetical protein